LNPAFEYELNIRCVAPFNALFINELKAQESDTTGDAQKTGSRKKENTQNDNLIPHHGKDI
jgi:hypothetical protein